MKRKLLSLVLAFAMTAGLLTVGAGAAGPAYGDTVGHWAEGSIGRWSGHGIIQGNNGKFRPNGQLTCAQFAAILARLLAARRGKRGLCRQQYPGLVLCCYQPLRGCGYP